jgi:uncharacterized protein YbjQ (UPF0145 family)
MLLQLAQTTQGKGVIEIIFTLLPLLLFFTLPIGLLLLGWWVGSTVEKRHYRSIRLRETVTSSLPAVTMRTAPTGLAIAETHLVTGHVVISLDHFKRFLARIRQIFGGRIRAYESLVDRARREAVLRLKEACPDADIILNLRFETSVIGEVHGKRGLGAVEVLASGTAIRYLPQ